MLTFSFAPPGWCQTATACPRTEANIGRIPFCSFTPICRQEHSKDVFSYLAECVVAPLPSTAAAIKFKTMCVHGTWACRAAASHAENLSHPISLVKSYSGFRACGPINPKVCTWYQRVASGSSKEKTEHETQLISLFGAHFRNHIDQRQPIRPNLDSTRFITD